MNDEPEGDTLRDRITSKGEDALGKLAQELLENPIVTSAIARAFDARERAVSAQETAMSALNLPSAADLERLTRRLRSVSQRIEGLEDGVDRLDRRFEDVARAATPPDDRLAAIENQLGEARGRGREPLAGARHGAHPDAARAGAAVDGHAREAQVQAKPPKAPRKRTTAKKPA